MSPHSAADRRGRPRARPGFTVVELLFVMLIAGVLGALSLPQFARYMSRRNVVNATDSFRLSAARARAAAVERGDVMLVVVRPLQDSILIMSADATDTIDVLDYAAGEIQVDVIAGSSLVVCYVPRGYAHPGCGSGNILPQRVGFSGGTDTAWVTINAVGQVER